MMMNISYMFLDLANKVRLYSVANLIGRACFVQLLNGAADSLWESNNKGVRAHIHHILIRVHF